MVLERQSNSPLVGLSKTEHNDYRNQTRSDAFEACLRQRKVLQQGELRAKKENNIDKIHEKGRKINKLVNEERPY